MLSRRPAEPRRGHDALLRPRVLHRCRSHRTRTCQMVRHRLGGQAHSYPCNREQSLAKARHPDGTQAHHLARTLPEG